MKTEDVIDEWIELGEPEKDVYPFDGQPVWLTPDGKTAHPAVWRTTRSYFAPGVQWVYDSFWARHNAGGQRIDFIPIAYKKMEV